MIYKKTNVSSKQYCEKTCLHAKVRASSHAQSDNN